MCVAPSQQPGTLALHLETVSAQRIVKTSRPRNRVKIAEDTYKSLRIMISTPKSFRPILFWSHSFEGSPITQLPHPFGHRQPEPTPHVGLQSADVATCAHPFGVALTKEAIADAVRDVLASFARRAHRACRRGPAPIRCRVFWVNMDLEGCE